MARKVMCLCTSTEAQAGDAALPRQSLASVAVELGVVLDRHLEDDVLETEKQCSVSTSFEEDEECELTFARWTLQV